MSVRRILIITIIGVVIIAAAIVAMLLTPYLGRDKDPVPLPGISPSAELTDEGGQDALNRVEVSRDTIQAVVSQTLSRPGIYSRDIVVETYWKGGSALYDIVVNVADGITALKILPPSGIEKRIIVTSDTLYVWYKGDRTPYIGPIDSLPDGQRAADEWQMIITYEDLLELDPDDIVDAGYAALDGEDFIYAEYLSPLLGYTMRYFVSIDVGLVVRAEEYDENGELVYLMTAGECVVGEADSSAFVLPDGVLLWDGDVLDS